MLSRLGKALLLAALCMLVACPALAKDEPTLRLFDGRPSAPADAGIELYRRSGKDYLFAPAAWDLSCLRLEYTGHDLLMVGDEPLPSGQTTSAFASGDVVTLTDERGREQYEIRVYQGSLPSLFLATESGNTRAIHSNKANREPGTLLMRETNGDSVYQGDLQEIRVRGNTTAKYDKKPYQIKLAKKTELIDGAGKARTWVLLADHTDLSLLRNRITLALSQEAGVPYAVDARSVDVYLNGIYRGVYLLTEKVQVNESRVAIDDQETLSAMLNPDQPLSSFERKKRLYHDLDVAWYDIPNQVPDVTGDYLLEIDKASRVRTEEEDGFCFTKAGFGVRIRAPEQPARGQVEYVADLMNSVERAIFSPDGVDAETGKSYADLIDVDSFALKFMMEDFSANYDARAGSQYFHKLSDAKGGKLYAGPAWDYDLTYASSSKTSADTVFHTADMMKGSYYSKLYEYQPAFRERVHELFEQRLRPALNILNGQGGSGTFIRPFDEYAQEIAASAEMNFLCNPKAGVDGAYYRTGYTHEEALAFLKQFLLQRTEAVGLYYLEDK